MNTIEIQGVSYVTARELELAYNLSRKRCWQLLKRSELPYIKMLQAHLYEETAATDYFNDIKK